MKRSSVGRAIARSEMKGEQRERRLRKYSCENCIEEKKQKKKKKEARGKRRGEERSEKNLIASRANTRRKGSDGGSFREFSS